MKSSLTLLLLLFSLTLLAQEDSEKKRKSPTKGAINIEISAGLNNTTPLGVQPKSLRDRLEDGNGQYRTYSGKLLPKTAAYVAVLIDYQFHEILALGTGLMYTPKGFWMFENEVYIDVAWTRAHKRKTFVTVDYFDLPIFFKFYTKKQLISFRFGPVISMALLSKVRIQTDGEKQKYRLGEGRSDVVIYDEIPNTTPKFIVPGFEAALSIGNTGGLQGTCVVGFSGSMYENSDWKSFVARLGLSYTISK